MNQDDFKEPPKYEEEYYDIFGYKVLKVPPVNYEKRDDFNDMLKSHSDVELEKMRDKQTSFKISWEWKF